MSGYQGRMILQVIAGENWSLSAGVAWHRLAPAAIPKKPRGDGDVGLSGCNCGRIRLTDSGVVLWVRRGEKKPADARNSVNPKVNHFGGMHMEAFAWVLHNLNLFQSESVSAEGRLELAAKHDHWRNRRFQSLSASAGQHLRNDRGDGGGLVLSERAFESVGALEGIGAGNLHLPGIAALRGEDHNAPVSRAVGEDVLNHCG
jgi:hypothetical protein